ASARSVCSPPRGRRDLSGTPRGDRAEGAAGAVLGRGLPALGPGSSGAAPPGGGAGGPCPG
ncbi:hypothetical protein P7K49_032705, partial [Saguinus oedipus]